MALYEFKCDHCHITTRSFPISYCPKTVKCDICGRDAKKMISLSNFKIKGYSYRNGYSKENNK